MYNEKKHQNPMKKNPEQNKQEAQGPHCSPESYWLIFCT
jgi:hypothetical protein